MVKHSQFPKPWWQVSLTVLPGLLFLLSLSQYLLFGTLIGLSLASFLLAFKHRNLFDLPVWGLIPLGLFAFWAFASIPYYYPTSLLLILISLPFSKSHGISAGLIPLIGGSFTANFAVEPSIYLWDSPFWRTIIIEGSMPLFMIVTPIWVLRSRTLLGQAMGLLFPLAAYITAFVYALSSGSGFEHPKWPQFSFSKAILIAQPFIVQFIILAIASAAYAWIASRTIAPNET